MPTLLRTKDEGNSSENLLMAVQPVQCIGIDISGLMVLNSASLLYNGLEGWTLEMKTTQYHMYCIDARDFLRIQHSVDNTGMTAPEDDHQSPSFEFDHQRLIVEDVVMLEGPVSVNEGIGQPLLEVRYPFYLPCDRYGALGNERWVSPLNHLYSPALHVLP